VKVVKYSLLSQEFIKRGEELSIGLVIIIEHQNCLKVSRLDSPSKKVNINYDSAWMLFLLNDPISIIATE
jgi:hypothetical protein